MYCNILIFSAFKEAYTRNGARSYDGKRSTTTDRRKGSQITQKERELERSMGGWYSRRSRSRSFNRTMKRERRSVDSSPQRIKKERKSKERSPSNSLKRIKTESGLNRERYISRSPKIKEERPSRERSLPRSPRIKQERISRESSPQIQCFSRKKSVSRSPTQIEREPRPAERSLPRDSYRRSRSRSREVSRQIRSRSRSRGRDRTERSVKPARDWDRESGRSRKFQDGSSRENDYNRRKSRSRSRSRARESRRAEKEPTSKRKNPRRRRDASAEDKERQKSDSPDNRRKRRSPSVEENRRKRSTSVKNKWRKGSPNVDGRKQKRSPSSERTRRRKENPGFERRQRSRTSPSGEGGRRKRSSSVENDRRRRSSASTDDRGRKRSPSFEDGRRWKKSPRKMEGAGQKRSPSVKRRRRRESASSEDRMRNQSSSAEEDSRRRASRSPTKLTKRHIRIEKEKRRDQYDSLELPRVAAPKIELDHLKVETHDLQDEDRPSSSSFEEVRDRDQVNEIKMEPESVKSEYSPCRSSGKHSLSEAESIPDSQLLVGIRPKADESLDFAATDTSEQLLPSSNMMSTFNVALHGGHSVLLVPGPIAGTYVLPGAETEIQSPQPASSTTPSHHAEGYSSGVDSDDNNLDGLELVTSTPGTDAPLNNNTHCSK